MAVNRQLLLKAGTLAHQVERVVEARLQPFGITPSLLAVLTHVRDLQPVAPSTIAAAAGMSATTLRDNVQRLVDRGLARRRPNPADGRSYLLTLTRRGEQAVSAADPALLDAYRALEQRLPSPLTFYEGVLDELSRSLADMLDEHAVPAATRDTTRSSV